MHEVGRGPGPRARGRAAAARSAATGSSRWAAGAWSTWRRRWRPRRAPGGAGDVARRRGARDGRPTTLSGAEMTSGHRHARGVDESTPRVRAAVVDLRPGARRLAARAGARRELAQRARPRRRGAVHGAREPGRDARRPRGRAADRRGLGGATSPTARRSRSARCWPAT